MRDAAIYTQKLDGATLAILWGGLQTADPVSWMNLMSLKYCGHNAHNTYVELGSNDPFHLRISPKIIISNLNNIPFEKYANKRYHNAQIYQHVLTSDGKTGDAVGEIVIIYTENSQNIEPIQKSIINKRRTKSYSIYVEEHLDNLNIRIIIFNIEKLTFDKFETQRMPAWCELGQISHRINDENISSLAYITRDWLSYMTSIARAKKQVNEDTLRYLLCDFWERRITGTFASEEHYERFPSKEMDIQWDDKGILYLMEIKYVCKNTDQTKELRRIFNDIYRLSLEKKERRRKGEHKTIRSLFVIFGPAFLFEQHLKKHAVIYTGAHPNSMYNVRKDNKHILEECFSFYIDEPHKDISDNKVTRSYYEKFNNEYEKDLVPSNFTTDLLELALADNVFDMKQQCVAIWEIDREGEI